MDYRVMDYVGSLVWIHMYQRFYLESCFNVEMQGYEHFYFYLNMYTNIEIAATAKSVLRQVKNMT